MSVVSKFLNHFGAKVSQDIPYEAILENIRDAVILVSEGHKVLYHNGAFTRLVSGEYNSCLKGLDFWSFFAAANPYVEYKSVLKEALLEGTTDFPVRSFNQTLTLTVGTFISCDNGSYIVILEDSSKQKEREGLLIREAKSDKLTGLLNRKGFDERLGSAIKGNQEDSKFKVGVLFIDLDEFKPINDTYGHDAGDLMLISVAERLSSTVEDFETAARIGGDEFVCIFPVCESLDDLRSKGERILKAVALPVETNDDEIGSLIVKCSIGGALYDSSISSADELMKKADEAMYDAKKSGKNQIRVR
ncbi:sensor domain-containing diguanylate cyclase [Vibrio parahaemolyticus]|uniref:Sensor domain-containing diguanylate cyclase n=1 Tax=Vibrio parahaemolyticus TaxID=670 RepID=A0AAW8PZM8_VIBPH|nr:sensor domain-containing diguanylate cyclase [Vibrio parahaemolyticus]EGR2229488.1 sensor domain-containing diguanylate cyclase [Vibrio parahaemolyticus]MDS1820885.1 sensor domain-containing diguanylate cyclase [Vibrio parahaemolyticus]